MDDVYKLREYGNVTVVSFRTPSLMNPTEVERIRGDLVRLIEADKRTHLVLDFTRVQFFSSQVIGVLLTLKKRLAAVPNGQLALCGVGPQLTELLRITRLDRLLVIKESRREAVKDQM